MYIMFPIKLESGLMLLEKSKQYIYQLAECIQLKSVPATKIHLVDSISVHFNIIQRTVLPTENYLSITIKLFTFTLCAYIIIYVLCLVTGQTNLS